MKLNVSVLNKKKNIIDLSHDVETSSDFGFCQPLMCRELEAQDTAMIRVGQAVQAMPMVLPTYGTINLKTYHSFVPAEDIYPPFNHLMSGETFRGNSSYVPLSVPYIRLDALSLLPFFFGTYTVYSAEVSDLAYYKEIENLTLISNGTEATILSYYIDSFAEDIDYDFSSYLALVKANNRQYLTVDNSSNDLSYYDRVVQYTYNSTTYLICFKLSRAGRNLRKVLIGCGYQLSNSSTNVSLLPLFAYYKAYFDLFGLQRYTTWENTPAYSLMQRYVLDNQLTLELFGVYDTDLLNFFSELATCYYTSNPDYISSHITGTAIQNIDNDISFISSATNASVTVSSDNDQNASLAVRDKYSMSFIEKMTRLVNLKTAFGGSIKNFMRSVFNADVEEPESHFIGSSKLTLNISKVMSTADTENAILGEFAGQGSGAHNGDNFKYHAKQFGFLVSMCAIVPESRFAQGVDQNLRHINMNDFYHYDYDLGSLVPTPKNALYGTNDFVDYDNNVDFSGGFGNIPMYSETKFAFNVINGDLSLASTRESYLPFNVDKILPYDTVIKGEDKTTIYSMPSSVITNGIVWRTEGLYKWLGNYDRIFENSGSNLYTYISAALPFLDKNPIDDNFIVFNYFDFKVSTYKKPLADSFDTADYNDDTMKVDKE